MVICPRLQRIMLRHLQYACVGQSLLIIIDASQTLWIDKYFIFVTIYTYLQFPFLSPLLSLSPLPLPPLLFLSSPSLQFSLLPSPSLSPSLPPPLSVSPSHFHGTISQSLLTHNKSPDHIQDCSAVQNITQLNEQEFPPRSRHDRPIRSHALSHQWFYTPPRTYKIKGNLTMVKLSVNLLLSSSAVSR